MTEKMLQEAVSESVEPRYSKDGITSSLSLLTLLVRAGDLLPPWWSTTRDRGLRNFWKTSDHLAGAIYTMNAKMTTIPLKVVAKDKSIKAHVAQAQYFTDLLIEASQFGEGWTDFYGKFVEDLFTQDNGAFAEVIGPGPKDGPLEGTPLSLVHLDSARCTRTNSPIYPVLYTSSDGRIHKLHYSRVIYKSQMPSTILEMNGVGFCAVSRVVNAAQNLIDMSIYKQEKLGSRPQRQLMLTGGGLDPTDLQIAFQTAEMSMNNAGLRRFSRTIVAGNRLIPDPKLEVVDMAGIPDGFDEKESTILGMAVISMGFGMDARELFPGMEGGATKADAIVQHIKQRGKGPGQTLELTTRELNAKFLPPYLEVMFDFQDDQQDRQAADIWGIRSQARQRDLLGGVTTQRVEREKMVQAGEISQEQFEAMELADGRLEDGVTVDVLFQSNDKTMKEFLGGVNESNYESKLLDIQSEVINSRDNERIKKARQAIAAINYKFVKPAEEQAQFDQQMQLQQMRINAPLNKKPGSTPGSTKPDTSYQEEKLGRKLPGPTIKLNDEENRTVKESDDEDTEA